MESKSHIVKQLGRLIRQLRVDAGLSQEEFAAKCGLHRTYVGAIERGEKSVTIDTAAKLAKALNKALSEIFVLLEAQDIEQ